jgi:putative iron-dependent peroxidase
VWRQVAPENTPPGMSGFDEDLVGVDGYSLPATQHDLWLWVAGQGYDKVFDVARGAIARFAPIARLVDEIDGWTYKENRDLTGFIDGTENPSLADAPGVAIVSDGCPGAGGSIVLTQKWLHDAVAWEALPIEDQERVIGRTKPDSIELDEEVRSTSCRP